MRHSIKIICISIVLSYVQALGCGGDGPIPLKDISSSFHPEVKYVHTPHEVKEFVYLEKAKQILYRNNQWELNSFDVSSGEQKKLSSIGFPLSKTYDPSENFLLTKVGNTIFNIKQKDWSEFTTPSPIPTQLFWQNEVLYTLNKEEQRETTRYIIHFHSPNSGFSGNICEFSINSSKDAHLAWGHTFPYIYLYRIFHYPGTNEQGIKLYRINVANQGGPFCAIQTIKPFARPTLVKGKIKKVFLFPTTNGMAIQLENPEMNLFWKQNNYCSYMDVGTDQIMPMNPYQPVLARFHSTTGLKLIYLEQEQSAEVLSDLNLTAVTKEDLWINRNGREMVLSPRTDQRNNRKLFHLSINQIPNR